MTKTSKRFIPSHQIRRFAAVGETLFVVLAANLIMLVLQTVGFGPALFGVSSETFEIGTRTGLVEGLFIAIKFAFALFIGYLFLKRCYGMGLADVGITRADQKLSVLLVRGFVLGCVAALPWLVLMAVNSVAPLGEGVAGWQAIEDAPFDIGFVVFALAAMVLIPPLMEECVMRGYMRGRLQIDFGPAGAAIISSVLFVLAHGHFYGSDAVLAGTQVTLFFAFTVLAYDTYRSGSVIPAIVAHAMINLPIHRDIVGMGTAIIIVIVVLMITRSAVAAGIAEFRRDWAATEAKTNVWLWAVIGGGLMAASILYRPSAALLLLFALGGAAVSIRAGCKSALEPRQE
jgi:membrane protease YdiL (CAAX protease family)